MKIRDFRQQSHHTEIMISFSHKRKFQKIISFWFKKKIQSERSHNNQLPNLAFWKAAISSIDCVKLSIWLHSITIQSVPIEFYVFLTQPYKYRGFLQIARDPVMQNRYRWPADVYEPTKPLAIINYISLDKQ